MTSVHAWISACLLVLLCALLPRAYDQQPPPVAAQPQLVILDTDIGDDIDDAFALALALRSPELHLLGVTTTYGDTELRARLVSRFLRAAGRGDLPVASGVPTPHGNVFTQAAYARRAPRVMYAGAIGFLLEQIRAHPGQITLIAIGPLTNVQAAIQRDPATFRKLKRVVMMGGSIRRGYDDPKTGAHRPPDAEWNLKCDPAGAQALLASGVPVFLMPLDATQVHLGEQDRSAIFAHGSALTDQLTLLYPQWLAGNGGSSPTPTLFDPVAVAYAFQPALCSATPVHLRVDEKGFTREVAGEPPNAQVCLHLDEHEFRKMLLERLIGNPGS